MKEAEEIIDIIHNIWEQNRKAYPAGYAVFYSTPRPKPDLMLIGLNPGGGPESFNGKKECLMRPEQAMEYIEYQNDSSYPLAGKTVSLFQSIGMLPTLNSSLKTNINFFRSRSWASLPREHAELCLALVLQMIEVFQPKLLLCESILIFDWFYARMKAEYSSIVHKELGKRNRRIYTSVWAQSLHRPVLIAAYTHLTGSRPNSSDVERIKQALRSDFARAFTLGDGQ
jgi:hypothetical protein